MKKFLFLCFLCSHIKGFSQDTTILAKDTSYWKKKAQFGFGVNQAAFSDNWRAGGVSSVAFTAFLNADANYLKDKISWDNSLRSDYGILKNKGQNLRKNIDRILIDSKFGYQISKSWNLFASLNFLSQFDAGFEYDRKFTDAGGNVIAIRDNLISKFMAPAFLTEALGLEYKPAKYFWLRFGAISMRQTFVLEERFNNNRATDLNGNGIINEAEDGFNLQTNYGVAEGKNIRNELALLTLEADFNKEIAKNLILQAHYWSFTTYQNPAATDIRFEMAIIAKINKIANVRLAGALLYDQDQDLQTQYSQSFTLNFAINWEKGKK